MTRGRILIASAAALAALALAFVLAGCGGGDQGGPDPAAVVPADAALYADALVRPEGDQKEAVDSLLSAVLDTNDPGAEITSFIDDNFDSKHPASFERDIDPWLGDDVGVFSLGDSQDEPTLTLAAATDTGLAVQRVNATEGTTTDHAYRGVKYGIDSDGDAYGIISDFLANGDLEAFKKAVDVWKGEADSLADSKSYKDATADLPGDSLATFYIGLDDLVKSAADQSAAGSLIVDKLTDQIGVDHAIAGSVNVTSDSAEVDLPGVSTGGTELLGSVPSEAIFAFGLSDVGSKAQKLIAAVEDSGLNGVFSGAVGLAVQVETGIDLGELLPQIGDAAVFVTGTSEDDLGGAVMLESKDTSATSDAIDSLRDYFGGDKDFKLQGLGVSGGGNGFTVRNPGASEPINVVERGKLVVIGYGDAATEQALKPDQTLAQTPGFKDAGDDIDTQDANLYASVSGIATLIASSTQNGDGYEQVRPYLERLGALIGAGSGDGFKLQLNVK